MIQPYYMRMTLNSVHISRIVTESQAQALIDENGKRYVFQSPSSTSKAI